MTIQILPAQLANQIAAGEVVERPASVVKELVENSIDAKAKNITIEIDKGGAKRIKITDDGCGIAKVELTLALSRHATSKISSLDDLEAIVSLGFRGEALASISSVSRLTLTSKPEQQSTAWQAKAEGRDMNVSLSPAAHALGTTIDVQDLFFNTPARRKFLRTEKTEFSHIEEVVRRIALAEFSVTFTLIHNGKQVKQYRAITDKQRFVKRIATACGQSFVDNALEVNCHHESMHLWGWIAKPTFNRQQNDLCFSYVNGRMMRDKLINHAIRQAYADQLPDNSYPAFVLYLTLDAHDVDVNVHPAKHEVRFQQSRYVHDFIFSVVNKSLQTQSELEPIDTALPLSPTTENTIAEPSSSYADYVVPIQNQHHAKHSESNRGAGSYAAVSSIGKNRYGSSITNAANNYYQLLGNEKTNESNDEKPWRILKVVNDNIVLFELDDTLYCAQLSVLAAELKTAELSKRFHEKLISQPLLLPTSLALEPEKLAFINNNLAGFVHAGFVIVLAKNRCQIRQCPAQFRQVDINTAFNKLVVLLMRYSSDSTDGVLTDLMWCKALALVTVAKIYDKVSANFVFSQATLLYGADFNQQLRLKSQLVDLTSIIKDTAE